MFDADGTRLYVSPEATYKAGRDAPAWFSRYATKPESGLTLKAPARIVGRVEEISIPREGDLLAAFKQLDVDPVKQIEILRDLHRSGSLHARLIIDGSEG